MENKLRWGIVGAARIARRVIPAIQRSRNGMVTALASRSKDKADAAAQEHGIPRTFDSYQALLECSDVDAVYIPLPNHLHKEWAIRAAEHGKHVLVEKPFALNAGQVEDMIRAARANQVLLAEAFMYQYHPQFRRLRELIDQGAIGEIQVIRSAFTFRMNDPRNIRMIADMGGGSLMDVGCYCVSMTRRVANAEPTEVQASAVFGETGVDETLAALLKFPNNVLAHFDCSFRTDYREWLEVQGNKQRLHLPRPIKPGVHSPEIHLSYDETSETNPSSLILSAPAANHYRLMVEEFSDAVLGHSELRFPAEDGLANMRVVDALYESARTGRAVGL